MVQAQTLKERLLAGEACFGAWISAGSATNAELMGHLGFDFLVLDLEHGQGDLMDAIGILRAAQFAGTPVIVRVPSHDAAFLKRVLDSGADGVMIPQVETAEEAEAVVAACRYPPAGIRGYAAGAVRASGYGANAAYARDANDRLLIVVQIESVGAVGNAASICAVDGVDVVFIGVNDLAGSAGRLEQTGHADTRALVAKVETVMRASGKIMGTVPSDGATAAELYAAGYRLVPVTSDVSLLRAAGLAVVREQVAALGRPR